MFKLQTTAPRDKLGHREKTNTDSNLAFLQKLQISFIPSKIEINTSEMNRKVPIKGKVFENEIS